MKKVIILAFACCLMAIGCGEKKEKGAKAPMRVKTVVVSEKSIIFAHKINHVQ